MLRHEQVGGRRGEVRAQGHAEAARQLHLVLGVELGLGLGLGLGPTILTLALTRY